MNVMLVLKAGFMDWQKIMFSFTGETVALCFTQPYPEAVQVLRTAATMGLRDFRNSHLLIIVA